VSKDVSKKSKRKKAKSKDRPLDLEDNRDSDQARDGERVRDHDRAYSGRDRDDDRARDSERSRDYARGRDRDLPRNNDRVRERGRDDGGRIVERRIEREYDVPSEDRPGRRKRVIVIDRDDERSERTIERSERGGDFFFGRGGFPFGF
jgi:hypothetical protein